MQKSTKSKSQWTATVPSDALTTTQPLPKAADVIIVGGGIAGVSTAHQLARAGKKVVLLEMASSLGAGDTGQTTAHLTQLFDAGTSLVRQNFGDKATRAMLDANAAAITSIEQLCQQFDADFERIPAYLFAHNENAVKTVNEEYDALAALGQPVERCNKPNTPLNSPAALRLPNQARFHPLHYCAGLATLARKADATFCLETRYESFERNKKTLTIKTSAGTLEAHDLVFATHTPATLITLQTKQTPQRTYALAARCDALPENALFYDTDEPYHYIRRHPHGDEELLIVGGCDHRVGETQPSNDAMRNLEAYARKHFDIRDVVYRWSGQVFEPTDGLPFIGPCPGEEHVWVITGMSGQGMTWSTVGAQVCADGILQRENVFAPFLNPSRIKPLAQASEFLHHNKDVSSHMLGDRFKAWIADENVQPGEGKVARHEGHVAALYHDGKEVHAISAVCPHAGCLVQWNGHEKSWDCPCHGSRFSAQGQLLCGPAVSDLKKIE